jgi:hypothetical protein
MVPEVKMCVGGQRAGRQDHPPSKIVADVQITLYDVGERLSGRRPYPDLSRAQKSGLQQCLSRNTHLGDLDVQRIQGTSMKTFRPQLRKADMSLSESFGLVAFKWSLRGSANDKGGMGKLLSWLEYLALHRVRKFHA